MSIARNTAYNFAGSALPILVTIVVTPLYLKAIGVERFGLLAICWTLLGALGFLSLGMGPAVAQRLATMNNDPGEKRSQIVWTALFLSIAAALIGSMLILLLSKLYFSQFKATPAGLRSEIEEAIPWLAAGIPLLFATGVFTGAIQGRQRFGLLSVISVSTSVLISLIPLSVAWFVSVRLEGLIIATLCVNLASVIALFFVGTRVVPIHKPTQPTGATVLKLASYGGWVTGTSLLVPIVTWVDRFLIGATLGPAAVSAYVIPYNLVSRVIMLPASFSSASLPRFAGADSEEVRGLQALSVKTLVALLTPISVVTIAALGPFLHIWIGPSLASAGSPVGSILIAGFWVHGVGHIPSTILLGRGRPDIITKLLLAYLVPYLLVLYVLTVQYGIVGAAIAWSLRAACDPVLFLFTKPDSASVLKIIKSAAVIFAATATALLLSWSSALYWLLMSGLLALSCYLGRESLSHWLNRASAWVRVPDRA